MGAARILVVCTGNVCRSPLAERLLRAGLGLPHEQVSVESAGIRALVGETMTEDAADELRAQGGDPRGFVSRQLTADMVREADLVVTATRWHRSQVVQLVPTALRCTFTLRELGRLLEGADLAALPPDPAGRTVAVAALAASRRGRTAPGEPDDDDVEDPFGRPRAQYARTTAQIQPAVAVLVRAISGAQ